jgi:signal recognition particle subunit SEC65
MESKIPLPTSGGGGYYHYKMSSPSGLKQVARAGELTGNGQATPDFARWRTIYPAYINVNKTIAEGRKVAKEFCVANPDPREIAFVCVKSFGFQCVIEGKAYSRDFRERGRVRVLMTNPDGSALNPDCKSRLDLLKACGPKILELDSRKSGKPLPAIQLTRPTSASTPSSPSSPNSASASNSVLDLEPEPSPEPVASQAASTQAPASEGGKKKGKPRRRY